MSSNLLQTYLEEVRSALGNHPEKEDIIHELHAHIWDFANNLSRKTGAGVEESFALALESMEDPETLARTFHTELATSTPPFGEPKSFLPEKKLTDQEFMVLGVIGFIASTIILSIISWFEGETNADLGAFNFIIGLIQFGILITLILGYLYYRNEQEFKSQMLKLKHTFEKMDRGEEDDEITLEIKGKLTALKVHVKGFFQLGFGIFSLFLILYITYIGKWQVFTPYWFSIGLYLAMITAILEIMQATVKMFVGEIRMSRLIYGLVQMFAFVSGVLYLIFYPYDLAGFFPTIGNTTGVKIVNFIQSLTSRPDYWFKILIGIGAVSGLMEAFYNLGKFGAWEPSEQKSLTMKSNEVKV